MLEDHTEDDLLDYNDYTDERDEFDDDFRPWGMDHNQFCALMHLAQFAGFIVPLAGYILPVVMWTTFKEQSAIIDQHGKNILNWMISFIIYITTSVLLIIVIIGIPLLIALAIMSIVFAIIGAVKAGDGIIYKYPLTINFIR